MCYMLCICQEIVHDSYFSKKFKNNLHMLRLWMMDVLDLYNSNHLSSAYTFLNKYPSVIHFLTKIFRKIFILMEPLQRKKKIYHLKFMFSIENNIILEEKYEKNKTNQSISCSFCPTANLHFNRFMQLNPYKNMCFFHRKLHN